MLNSKDFAFLDPREKELRYHRERWARIKDRRNAERRAAYVPKPRQGPSNKTLWAISMVADGMPLRMAAKRAGVNVRTVTRQKKRLTTVTRHHA